VKIFRILSFINASGFFQVPSSDCFIFLWKISVSPNLSFSLLGKLEKLIREANVLASKAWNTLLHLYDAIH